MFLEKLLDLVKNTPLPPEHIIGQHHTHTLNLKYLKENMKEYFYHFGDTEGFFKHDEN